MIFNVMRSPNYVSTLTEGSVDYTHKKSLNGLENDHTHRREISTFESSVKEMKARVFSNGCV